MHDIYNPPIGTIWEPRAYWDVARIDGSESAQIGSTISVQFKKEHFRNEGRYPVELDHVLIAPVGYTFKNFDGINDPPVLPVGDFGACASVIQKSKILISVPNRQHYGFDPLPISTWTPQPVDDILMNNDPGFPAGSGMLGVCRWDFDPQRRLVLPRNANCTLQLGRFLLQPAATGPSFNFPNRLPAHVAFWEEGIYHEGSKQFPWNAHGRWRAAEIIAAGDDDDPDVFPIADGLGFNGGTDANTSAWSGESAVRFKDYKDQESSRAGHNSVGGFAVHIDQIDYDAEIQTDAAYTGFPIAPISLRLPCRARSDAMSQEWWWREGAPLALVCPSLTPAQVYKLPQKITLHKGDVLEVEMQVPGGIETTPASPSTGVFSIFQVGISFTGYAAIKG
jgi:hypothetical protein